MAEKQIEVIEVVEKLTVSFGKGRILPNGDFGTVTIRQSEREIVLTPEQARSLMRVIRNWCGTGGE